MMVPSLGFRVWDVGFRLGCRTLYLEGQGDLVSRFMAPIMPYKP